LRAEQESYARRLCNIVPAAEFERGELRVFCNASHCTADGKAPREEERKGRKEDLYPLTDGSYLNKGMDF